MSKNLSITLALLFLSCTWMFAQKEIHQAIYFDSGSASLNKSEKVKLDSLADFLLTYHDFVINITGNTDATGSARANAKLGSDRGDSVSAYLISRKIPANRIMVVSDGEGKPVASNDSPEGRAKNRRVEISVGVTVPIADMSGPDVNVRTENSNGGGGGGEPQTIVLPPGQSSAGGYGFNVITNTAQMEAMGLTTQTTSGEPLVSNVMVCITSTPTDTTNRMPVKILVPASFNPYCKVPDVILYDSQQDTTDGNQIKWMPLLFPDMKPVVVNGVEYFEWTISPGPQPRPCKNADCPKRNAGEVTIRLKSGKYEMVSLSAVYPDANALLRGHAVEKNKWQVKTFSNDSISSPHIKVVVKDKNGKLYITDMILRDIKQNKNGEYILKKKMFVKRDS